jgi:hypothetical protein
LIKNRPTSWPSMTPKHHHIPVSLNPVHRCTLPTPQSAMEETFCTKATPIRRLWGTTIQDMLLWDYRMNRAIRRVFINVRFTTPSLPQKPLDNQLHVVLFGLGSSKPTEITLAQPDVPSTFHISVWCLSATLRVGLRDKKTQVVLRATRKGLWEPQLILC